MYWDYKCNSDGKIVIDQETYDRIATASYNCKQNKDFDEIFSMKDDIEFDEYKVYNEKELKYDLRGKNYGLKGILDRFVVNSKSRTVYVYDLKTGEDVTPFDTLAAHPGEATEVTTYNHKQIILKEFGL